MDKYGVAQILREMGSLIELIDENPQKSFAYRRAAHTIESLENFETEVANKTLESFPGIGQSISRMVTLLAETDHLPYYEQLKNQIPPTLLELTYIPGLGIKKLRLLYEKLHVTNLANLEEALRGPEIQQFRFGPSKVKKILKNISRIKTEGNSFLYANAYSIAQAIVEILKPYVERIEIAGELRRKLELIRHLDFVVISKDPEECLKTFAQHPLIRKISKMKPFSLDAILKMGLTAHVEVVSEKAFPFVFWHATGSEEHILEWEEVALENGYKMKKEDIQKEEQIYQHLGISFIPPELREGYGEIAAAKKGKFQHLIEEKDLKGAFHCHTTDSDGHNSLEEMVIEAKKIGWEYIGISDHSKSSYQANGLTEERLLTQVARIKQLNEHQTGFYIFSGIECDVLKDGQLDFEDGVLSKLDFVIASLHSFFRFDEETMTKRLLKAIENPYTTMIGHLTGRILRHRDPYALNIPKIIDACIANQKIIELNAYPSRLDMDWRLWIQAQEKGLKCCINPDAHSLKDLGNCRFGVYMARKGWLEKEQVINTLPLTEIRKVMKSNL